MRKLFPFLCQSSRYTTFIEHLYPKLQIVYCSNNIQWNNFGKKDFRKILIPKPPLLHEWMVKKTLFLRSSCYCTRLLRAHNMFFWIFIKSLCEWIISVSNHSIIHLHHALIKVFRKYCEPVASKRSSKKTRKKKIFLFTNKSRKTHDFAMFFDIFATLNKVSSLWAVLDFFHRIC